MENYIYFPIEPHGGELVNLFLSEKEKEIYKEKSKQLQSIKLDTRTLSDLEMLGIGGFSPLRGFCTEKDYNSIINEMYLSSGILWPIPITLMVEEEEALKVKKEEIIVLLDERNEAIAIMEIEDIYKPDKEKEALKVYKTKDTAHPAVRYLKEKGNFYIGGKVSLLRRPRPILFPKYHNDPPQTRQKFMELGWKSVVAFQTRNPVHRAHEYLQKCALEIVDGLLLHPIVGYTKEDDIPAEVRIKCYEVLLKNYYPQDRVMLSVLPAVMRYGGPREALLHAIIRQNYGVTHFIVGRDHAGVGNYYGPYEAQEIFRRLPKGALKIQPLFFENAFYCKRCGNMATLKTCPHDSKEHVTLSGTKVREMLSKGEELPQEFTRPEVAKILIEWAQQQGKKEDGT